MFYHFKPGENFQDEFPSTFSYLIKHQKNIVIFFLFIFIFLPFAAKFKNQTCPKRFEIEEYVLKLDSLHVKTELSLQILPTTMEDG